MKILLTAMMVSLVLLFGCAASNPLPQPNPNTTTLTLQTPAAASSAVQISNFAFNPSSMSVAKGTTVTWTNNDNTAHTITSTTGAFDSGRLQTGASWSFTFNTAGTYDYICSIHTSMKGQIVVTG